MAALFGFMLVVMLVLGVVQFLRKNWWGAAGNLCFAIGCILVLATGRPHPAMNLLLFAGMALTLVGAFRRRPPQ
jgi:hypothetical protein